eukprot:4922955-Pleurochrysis_carterae.AAC.1
MQISGSRYLGRNLVQDIRLIQGIKYVMHCEALRLEYATTASLLLHSWHATVADASSLTACQCASRYTYSCMRAESLKAILTHASASGCLRTHYYIF